MKLNLALKSGKHLPHSSKQWKRFKYVLSSEKTINRYMGLLVAQEEADAGIALLNLPSGVSSTLHYDTTTRSCIDGDWVSIMLKISDEREFDLRPIFMAVEDRENIVNLIEETYNRIALAAAISMKQEVSAKTMWNNTTFLATDAVSKNYLIGEGLAKRLNTFHVPMFYAKAILLKVLTERV